MPRATLLPCAAALVASGIALWACGGGAPAGADGGQGTPDTGFVTGDARPHFQRDAGRGKKDAGHLGGPEAGPPPRDGGSGADVGSDAAGDVAATIVDASCPTAVPTSQTACPQQATGCWYTVPTDGGPLATTDCACDDKGSLECTACPAAVAPASACTGSAGLVCNTDLGLCGCVKGMWSCPGFPADDCPDAAPEAGGACATPNETCTAYGTESCVCSAGGIWVCQGCPDGVPDAGSPCQGGAPQLGCTYPEEVQCSCVNGAWSCSGGV